MDVDNLGSLLNKHTSTKQIEDYKIGDILWTKIGKYPFWPSIVCVEPTLNTYHKKKKNYFLHVRFLNDNGKRSWTKITENYCGKAELLSKYPNCLSCLKNNKKVLDAWDLAVVEADNLLKFDGEFRMISFLKTFCNSDSLTQSVLHNSSEGTSTSFKKRNYSRKRTPEIPEQDYGFKIMKIENTSVNSTPSSISEPEIVNDNRKLEIRLIEKDNDQDDFILPSYRHLKKKNTIHLNSSNSKITTSKKDVGQDNSTERNSICMSESEASSEKKAYSLVNYSCTQNKIMILKTSKRACVVCGYFDNTVKCKGRCQSFFHRECLNKSEERYHKKISSCCKIKDTKNEANNHQIINNIIDESVKITEEKNTLISPIKYMCSQCKADKSICYGCGLLIDDASQKIACKISSCGNYYHKMCLKDWPQCQWIQGSRNNVRCIVCPHHVCHLCVSENPEMSCTVYFPAEKLTRCIKCPTAYHRSGYCLPAGSKVLTYNDIICGRHFQPSKINNDHVNADWCFICGLASDKLTSCDLCPISFHQKCLNPSNFEGTTICEDCKSGRYPLYGEIVWVDIGDLSWWPAQVVFPQQIPDTVNAVTHSVGQFVVQFFGSHNDYCWVNRGQVYNFDEADINALSKSSHLKSIHKLFQEAVEEAAQAHTNYILEKSNNDSKVKDYFKMPPRYTKIKFNKHIGNVKKMEFDITTMSPCECDPSKPNPCGPDSNCLNRILLTECNPKICPAKNKCNNQSFENALYPAMETFLTEDRGWGLKTLEDIKEGSFVIEYVGDLIDEKELQLRCLEMNQRNEQNFYFLTLDGSRTIDAGPKGNLSRFMNHSCEPNCITQKWIVNGDTRIGLFAIHDIPTGTELVFDYRWQSCLEVVKKPCNCGAARCSKFIGVKVEEQKKVISTKRVQKRKTVSKSNQSSLKLKDKVSGSDQSKSSSQVINNDKNISTTENELEVSNAETIDLSMKSKSKSRSNYKPSIILKNRNFELTQAELAVKNHFKYSTRSSTSMLKENNKVGLKIINKMQAKN